MPSPSTILIYGLDSKLLDTRRWVLEHEGFDVRTTNELAEANQVIVKEQVDLSILCHTVSDEDCRRFLTVAHAAKPGLKSLVLETEFPACAAGSDDVVLNGFADPRTLVAAVRKAIQPTEIAAATA